MDGAHCASCQAYRRATAPPRDNAHRAGTDSRPYSLQLYYFRVEAVELENVEAAGVWKTRTRGVSHGHAHQTIIHKAQSIMLW